MKPPITGVEIYLTTLPALNSQKTTNQSPHSRLMTGTNEDASWDPSMKPMPVSAFPTITAGIASTPTTNCGELVRSP